MNESASRLLAEVGHSHFAAECRTPTRARTVMEVRHRAAGLQLHRPLDRGGHPVGGVRAEPAPQGMGLTR